MTEFEIKLVAAGNALARSLGHKPEYRCPKVSPAVPCNCGAAQEQAKALDDWQKLTNKNG